VDIDICHLQEEPTNRLRKAVKDFGLDHQLPFYDIKEHRGWLRNLQLRICTTGEIMANLVVGHEDEEMVRILGDQLMQQFPELTTLLLTVNTKWNDSITGLEPRVLYGKGYVWNGWKTFFSRSAQNPFSRPIPGRGKDFTV
jgi:23S rRNA (uracil1939-C5)-methyltransferase